MSSLRVGSISISPRGDVDGSPSRQMIEGLPLIQYNGGCSIQGEKENVVMWIEIKEKFTPLARHPSNKGKGKLN